MKIARWQDARSNQVYVGQLLGDRLVNDDGQTFAPEAVRWLVPVVPSKIVCVGKNYLDHAAEMGGQVPERPLLFFKPPSALNAPGAPVCLPASSRVDFEGEIAVVIGRRCKDVTASEAAAAIWGYSCFTDVSDRQAQAWEGNWVRAKGFDTSACLGPVLATPDEVPDPIEVITRVNGTERQRGDTSQLAFSIPVLIETVSRVMTLERGDVIATGTPAGVGPLQSGDVVEVEVAGVGVLRNPVT